MESTETSLSRGLRILDLVAQRGHTRVAELSEALDIPLSTVYRYVRRLIDSEYLVDVDGYLCVGPKLSSEENRRQVGHLVQIAAPTLRGLARTTDEAAILTVRVGTTALCLDRVMPRLRYGLSFHRGSVRPLYAGASATILLAFAPHEVASAVLAATRQKTDGPDPIKLERGLAQAIEQGFIVSHGEVDLTAAAVAAPVFRGTQCVCGISVAGPRRRLVGEALDAATEAVVGAAQELTDALNATQAAAAWVPGETEIGA